MTPAEGLPALEDTTPGVVNMRSFPSGDTGWVPVSTWRDRFFDPSGSLDLGLVLRVRRRSEFTDVELALMSTTGDHWQRLIEVGATLHRAEDEASHGSGGAVFLSGVTGALGDLPDSQFAGVCGVSHFGAEALQFGETRASTRTYGPDSAHLFCIGTVTSSSNVTLRTSGGWSVEVAL